MELKPADSVGMQVRHRLRKTGKTQAALAEHLDLTQQSVSRRLLGAVPFDINELVKVADFFEIPLSELLNQAEPSKAVSA